MLSNRFDHRRSRCGAIVVVDGHESGCDDTPELPPARLDKRARLADSAQSRAARTEQWDAIALVGMHASPGRGGFLEHVGTFGQDFIENGVSINESDVQGLIGGERGIPVIFASGDDRLVDQVRSHMPWVTTTAVKRATSRSSAELRPAPEVAADLRAHAESAMRHRSDAKAVVMVPPFTGAFKPVYPESIELVTFLPGLDVRDGLIHVTGASFPELHARLEAIGWLVEKLSRADVYSEVASRHPAFQSEADSLWDQKWAAGPPTRPSKP